MKAHRIPAGDVELAAWTQGPEDAPVIVLAHGYPDTHSVWDRVAAMLAARFRVITWDVRGVGESTSSKDFSLAALSRDLRAVLGALAAVVPVDPTAPTDCGCSCRSDPLPAWLSHTGIPVCAANCAKASLAPE